MAALPCPNASCSNVKASDSMREAVCRSKDSAGDRLGVLGNTELCGYRRVAFDPGGGMSRDFVERTGFLEQMRRAGNDLEPRRSGELRERDSIQLDHRLVVSANNEQSGSAHAREPPAGEIRASSAGHDRR